MAPSTLPPPMTPSLIPGGLTDPEILTDSDPTPHRVLMRPRETLPSEALPRWLPATLQNLNGVLRLRAGWDSYGARAVDHRLVPTVLEILVIVMGNESPAPWVGATPTGGVILEWTQPGVDIEVEISSSDHYTLVYSIGEEDREEELPTSDLRRLSLLVDSLRPGA